MSATNEGRGATPVLVVTPDELVHHVEQLFNQPVREGRAYTQAFEIKKTDLSAGTAAAITASRQVLGGDVSAVCGWSVRETTGAAVASFRLRDGSGTGNEVLSTVSLPAGGSQTIVLHGKGIEVSTGRVFLDFIAGSFEGVLYWR